MEKKGTRDSWGCYMLWAIGVVVFVMMLSAFIIVKYFDGWEHRGQFGDMFGFVNALFSGFAFAGLIITIRQQHQDLEYQRQAIDQTKLELQNQTKEFDEQNKTLRIQRFENTFFKMLEVQQSIVKDLYAADLHKERIEEDDPNNHGRLSKEVLAQDEYCGRNLFFYAFCRCVHHVDIGQGQKQDVYGLQEVIKKCGKKHFDDFYTTTVFDHYFRHLYTILKFITENDWLGEDRQYKYATFVRATLSRYELVMLYYNGFFRPKMKQMMERYTLLNNLRRELLPMSREYHIYIEKLGITIEDLQNAHFSGGDFEFFLTKELNDTSKYNLGAFYTPKEVGIGIEHLKLWNEYISRHVKVENVN